MTKKYFKSRIFLDKGFSLVEIVVAMAILAIVVVSLMTLLNASFSNLFNMGDKTETLNNLQSQMEKAIVSETYRDDDNNNVVVETKKIVDNNAIRIEDAAESILYKIQGLMITVEEEYSDGNGNNKLIFDTFIRDKFE